MDRREVTKSLATCQACAKMHLMDALVCKTSRHASKTKKFVMDFRKTNKK